MTNYYAVCDANGPISVLIVASSEDDAVAEFAASDSGSWIDDSYADAEGALGIDGSDMDEYAFSEALREAGYVMVRDLAAVINAHAGTVAHLEGGWRLWQAP